MMSPSLSGSESQGTPATNALNEIMALAERLAIQLEETSGNEYRLRLARACALALCDALHEIEPTR